MSARACGNADPPHEPLRRSLGFTLLESLLSLVILALIASLVGTVYFTGLKTYDAQGEAILVNSALRSRMEYLISLHFDELTSGSQNINILGQVQTVTWTVSHVDVDGNGVVDTTAKQITLTLSGRTLTTLVADTAGAVFKL